MNSIKLAKKTLRKSMKNKIMALSPQEKIDQSKLVTEKLFDLPEYKKRKNISVFLSMPDEIQTLNILKDVLNKNKNCFIPRYDKKSSFMDMVHLKSWNDYEKLPETDWGIKQPDITDVTFESANPEAFDLILVPGLAFTTDGFRLGRGRGYYDTFLKKHLQGKIDNDTTMIALSFKQQIVDHVPTEDTDVKIDLVLYPE